MEEVKPIPVINEASNVTFIFINVGRFKKQS
jgi:hypothetical protein